MTMTLADHERRKAEVRDQIAAEKKRHAETMGAVLATLQRVRDEQRPGLFA